MERSRQPATGKRKRQRGGCGGGGGRGVEPFGHFWLRSLGRCAAPDPTSHVIRGGVNQQLAAQMKKCQLLPGAQQADRPRRGCIPARPGFVISQPPTHPRAHTHTYLSIWVTIHSSIERSLTGFGTRMAPSCMV